jgi:SP family general alpha glucoside:H+ symporter-like MFS transporter
MASQNPDTVEPKTVPYNDNVEKIEAQHADLSENMNAKLLNEEAKVATSTEHSIGLWQGLKTYRKAALWSVLVSSSIIMEGYDTTLIGSFYGYPAFQKKYGTFHDGGAGWQLSAPWQAGISDIQAVGNIIGALANGYFSKFYFSLISAETLGAV